MRWLTVKENEFLFFCFLLASRFSLFFLIGVDTIEQSLRKKTKEKDKFIDEVLKKLDG